MEVKRKREIFAEVLDCRNTLQPKKRVPFSKDYTLVFAIFLILLITVFTSSSLILAYIGNESTC